VMNQRMALGSVALAAALVACAGLGCDSSGALPDCANPGDCYQEAGPAPIVPDAADAGGQVTIPDAAVDGRDSGAAATPDTGQPDAGKSDAADAAPGDAGAG